MFLATVAFGLLAFSPLTEQQGRDCSSEADQGEKCSSNRPVLRYYYDATMAKCLPFLYKGCGGNGNNYGTPRFCWLTCTEMDQIRCGAGEKPTGRCNNKGLRCSAGSVCRLGPFGFGLCCDSKTEAIIQKEWEPICAEEKVLIKQHNSLGWEPFNGRKCWHEFCPEGSECVQGRYLAHCCGSVEKFGKEKANYKIIVEM